MASKRVGIFTWHYYSNFGSALQAYALQQTVQSLGHRAEILNYRNPKYSTIVPWKYALRAAAYKTLGCIAEHNIAVAKRLHPYLWFQHCRLNETHPTQSADGVTALANRCDAVIAGSDQIWAPNVFNPLYMLSFVPNGVSKISYAASIGLNDIPEELREEYRRYLCDFSAVSVRETAGAALLAEHCGITAEVMPDPTLTVERAQWDTLKRRPPAIQKPYIFCYFLNKEHTYRQAVSDYAAAHGLTVVGCSSNAKDKEWMRVFTPREVGPREFLGLIDGAAAVVTDSYHGTIFSLLYHKEFMTFERFADSDAICQNSRIFQLADYFDIHNRIIKATDALTEIPAYDYGVFETRVSELRKRATAFLTTALEGQ